MSRRTTLRFSSSRIILAPRSPWRAAQRSTSSQTGVESALALAREAADDRSVVIAGGAATVNQYLAARLIDELRLHVAPVLLGAGKRLFEGVGDLHLELLDTSGTELVAHLTYRIVP
jgi:dihydrofolate reductase